MKKVNCSEIIITLLLVSTVVRPQLFLYLNLRYNTVTSGFLLASSLLSLHHITQNQVVNTIDITSAKVHELSNLFIYLTKSTNRQNIMPEMYQCLTNGSISVKT